GSSTFVYVKNVTGKSQQYHLQLSYEVDGQDGIAGVYSPGLVTIEGGQTITLDIRQLRDEQVADEAGRLIPVEASRGQVLWSVRGKENLTLIGRAEQSDRKQGLSSSYACVNGCDDSYLTSSVTPSSTGIVVNDGAIFTARQTNETSYGTMFTFTVSANWSSSNTNVATIDSSGFVTGKNPGQTTIKASWDTYRVEPPLQPLRSESSLNIGEMKMPGRLV
ncbi:MAG: Ig-like domain-containing protein, partial [Blastocatellia bacterium]|nr:Ig-like domain-containing protein [Blastocatellia bacterium]